AERQYQSNRRLEEQGVLAPVDVVAAQTQVATFQQMVFTAQQSLTAAENNLKSLMLANRQDVLWGMALIPETPPAASIQAYSYEEAVRKALRERPEIAEAGIALGINGLDQK